jgi:hypothetical protein
MADPQIQQAALLISEKGANPRLIRSALSNALLLSGKERLTTEDILFAARDLCGATDLPSAIYADLWAIKCCSSTLVPALEARRRTNTRSRHT